MLRSLRFPSAPMLQVAPHQHPRSPISTLQSCALPVPADENFQYDVDYISATMGWEAAPQPSAGGGAGGAVSARAPASAPLPHRFPPLPC
jgi:hypothetical protein